MREAAAALSKGCLAPLSLTPLAGPVWLDEVLALEVADGDDGVITVVVGVLAAGIGGAPCLAKWAMRSG